MGLTKEVVIFHFLPLEIYPPIINLGTYLSEIKKEEVKVIIITTKPNNKLSLVSYPNVDIIRYIGINPNSSSIIKFFRYVIIYLSTFLLLCKRRPKAVLYFETLSSLPILLFKKVFKEVAVFIHYHEIFSNQDLSKGRTLNKLLNKIEIPFFMKAVWISHTNRQRISIFKKQYKLNLGESVLKVLPNYPSKNWARKKAKRIFRQDGILKIVHIGALSLDSLYLKDVLEFFGNKKNVKIDFFSHSIKPHILEQFKQYDNIRFRGSIDYNSIPALKGIYDIGLVLYKGNSLNFVYNAPNKIFEYLALDLDVWCSDKLITAHDYKNEQSFPKLLMVDFSNLKNFNIKKALNREGLFYKRSPYFCEDIYKDLWNRINESIKS